VPFLFGILAGSALVGGLVYAVVRVLMRRSLPVVDGVLKAVGLGAPVEVIRDRWGVPHIYAASLEDALFAQGYVHAQDRLWQMELNRRTGHGRLAELFGPVAASTDQFLRTIGLSRAAQNDWQALGDSERKSLQTYSRGVNAFLAANGARLPLEFTLLRTKPEPWTPLDSLVFGKVMAWSLSTDWDMELINAALIAKVGPEAAARLMGDYASINPIVLPGQSFAALVQPIIAQFKEAQALLPLGGMGGMSNNWVVDGTKSVTGKPLLANDPHLALQMPSIWYENHLVVTPPAGSDEKPFEATGVSFAGVPFVVIGHNREIAWGFTNAMPDVQDLYVEKFNPKNPAEYEYQGQWQRAQIFREQIQVKGEAVPRMVEVMQTRHGPVITPLLSQERVGTELLPGHYALAFRWTAHAPGTLLRAVERMNMASNWDEFCEAVRDWDVPSQNMVYADRAGNIGYYMPGRVPLRAKGMGAVPAPGWSGEYEWAGWLPHEQLPHAFNPKEHFIATANNRVGGKEYPHFLTSATMNGNRAARIVELLNAKEQVSADDFAQMQVDLYCAPAKDFCHLLAAVRPTDGYTRDALSALAIWDYRLTKDSVAGAIYELTQFFAMRRVFGPWLGDLTGYYQGVGLHPLLAPFSPYHDRSLMVLQKILVNNESDWFVEAANPNDQGVAEPRDGPEMARAPHPVTREDILAAALDDTIAYLRQAVGQDIRQWAWGRIHQAGFNHVLGAQKPLDRIFNRGPYPYGGDTNTVWQAAWVPKLPISPQGGSASWRQIIDLSDWDASRVVHTTGQSGHPASKHYDDMIPLWLNGQYHPMLWARERVEANAEARLRLET
jgi:penicillin amidase